MAAEGNESFQIQIRTGSISGPVVATSATITVVDTPATYSIGQSATSVNEGSSVTFTITTTNVVNGTTVYWATTGTTSASDFSDSATSGSTTINSNSGSITRTLTNDLTTEGSENFTLRLYAESSLTTLLATSSTVTISDTSLTPPTTPPPTAPPPVAPTYSISPNISSVNEGSSVTFTITTTGVANGTILYWSTQTISGTINTSDFNDGLTSNSVTISSNSASVTRTLSNDTTTEGSESFRLQLRTGSVSGTVVATSSTVTINDTSLTPPTLPPPTTSLPPPTTPPPTTSLPPPTTSLPPPTSALPALSATITNGVGTHSISPTTRPFTVLGTYGSATRRVTFTRSDSLGGQANYELLWNGSSITDSQFNNLVYVNDSTFRTGTLGSGISATFFFRGNRSDNNQVGLRLTRAGATSATPTYFMPLSTVYTWANWARDRGLSSTVEFNASVYVNNIYNAGPWGGTYPNGRYGLNRLPDASGAAYWAQEGTRLNWTNDQWIASIQNGAISGGGRDAQAVLNGNQNWGTGTGSGPVQDQGTP